MKTYASKCPGPPSVQCQVEVLASKPVQYRIHYCAAHAATSEMLDVLKALRDNPTTRDAISASVFDMVCDVIAKAEGHEP